MECGNQTSTEGALAPVLHGPQRSMEGVFPAFLLESSLQSNDLEVRANVC